MIFPASGTSWFWWQLFSIQNLIWKVFKKMIFPSFWQLMLQGKFIYIYIYLDIFIYMYIEFLYIVHWFWKKTLMVGGGSNCTVSYIYTIWTHIFVYWIFIHSSLILEKTLMVGGVLTVRFRIYIYIYIYIRFGEYSASWWCPGISFTFKFIFLESFNIKKF